MSGIVLVEVYIEKGGALCYNLLDKVVLLRPDAEKNNHAGEFGLWRLRDMTHE